MKVIDRKDEMRSWSRSVRAEGKRIGFVPTMGALHEGHLSLVRKSLEDNDCTVVSIYVNPTQFGPGEDLERYPRDLEGDIAKLGELGVDCVFTPCDEEMYPAGFVTYVVQERLTEVLCGASRPGHFRGVLTIVLKLFNVVEPDNAYFGRKDYQQSVIVKRMVKDLDLPVRIHVMPVVREADGLAMSSRNAYLSPEERALAPCLYKALLRGREMIRNGCTDVDAVEEAMKKMLESQPGVRVDYVNVVHPETLQRVEQAVPPVVIAGAVYIGAARLIDNVVVEG